MTEDEQPEKVKDLRGPIRELREYARGALDVDHDDVHPAAGLVENGKVRRLLAFAEQEYEPVADMPRDFWETEFAQRIIRREAGETAARAVREGDPNRAAYLTGIPSYKADVSGMDAVDRLTEWLIESEQCKLIYIAALMGRGKSALAVKFLELIHRYYQRVESAVDSVETPTPELAANFDIEPTHGGVDVGLIQSWPALQEWADRGSSDDVRWFIFDEASTELTAQSGENAQEVAQTMGPFVKKMRKNGVNMVVIGHDRGDVHVAIRSMADFVSKSSLKKASFFEGIQSRKPIGHILSVEGLPDSSWEFDTDDMAEFSWGDRDGLDSEESGGAFSEDDLRAIRNKRITRIYWGTDLSQSAVGEYFGISQETVSGVIDQYEIERDGDQIRAIPPDGEEIPPEVES